MKYYRAHNEDGIATKHKNDVVETGRKANEQREKPGENWNETKRNCEQIEREGKLIFNFLLNVIWHGVCAFTHTNTRTHNARRRNE